jgi:hypothetical protein
MGAELIERTVRARSIKEAWDIVYRDAEEYSGHQEGYSGDFNTCQFTKDMTSFLKSMKTKQLDEYIEEHCPKREVWGYCIVDPVQNKNKVKSQVDVTPQKGTRKWETVYKAVTSWEDIEVARDKSQTLCIKKARVYIENNPSVNIRVIIAKELIEGNTQCATIAYKKSTTEKLGLYKFIGWAAS